jgi:three-Cys-motif partner protein
MPRRDALWQCKPHTKGKHLVLKLYLDAWFPILGRRSHRILFIDGFAGPGKYSGGEEGSPIIAMRALCEHRLQGEINAEVGFFFIEKEENWAEHLEQVVAEWEPKLPQNCWAKVRCGKFDTTLTEVLNRIDEQEKQLAPAFVMIDPFGVSGTPMAVIERILKNPSSEVYVTFMYDSMNRFGATEEFAEPLDELFGCRDWRKGVGLRGQEERKDFFYGLYEKQMRKVGAQHVIHFDLYEENRLVYGIFFGTQSSTGSDRMKQAIWRVAPFGDFAFHGTRSRQLVLNLASSDFGPLRVALRGKFRGRDWVSIGEVVDFVMSDKTDYHSGQVKREALVPMEKDGEIEVDERTRNRKRTYPEGTMVKFL